MSERKKSFSIGNVLRSDIRSFVVASRIPEPEVPTFGTFVRAPIQQGKSHLIGLVYDICLQDDPFLRNLAATVIDGDPRYAEVIRDQREVRAIPVEIAVVTVGYHDGHGYRYGFPPQPPMILHRIIVCSKEEVVQITSGPDFLRPLLDNRDVFPDDLIPTAVIRASGAHAEVSSNFQREEFLLVMGRYLARFMGRDPVRLERILRQIAP